MCLLNFWTIFLYATLLKFRDGYKILGLFPFNGKSHFVMFEQVMTELARKGHEVDVVSHFPLKEKEKNYNDFSLKGSSPEIQNNLTFNVLYTTPTWVKNVLIRDMNPLCDLLGHPVMQNLINGTPKKSYDLIVIEVRKKY